MTVGVGNILSILGNLPVVAHHLGVHFPLALALRQKLVLGVRRPCFARLELVHLAQLSAEPRNGTNDSHCAQDVSAGKLVRTRLTLLAHLHRKRIFDHIPSLRVLNEPMVGLDLTCISRSQAETSIVPRLDTIGASKSGAQWVAVDPEADQLLQANAIIEIRVAGAAQALQDHAALDIPALLRVDALGAQFIDLVFNDLSHSECLG
mmetsp:Transcript_98220/g.210638  ORF Transcript_98220/g.210638 Transcript_98220/m.210638 type:complete len:206 (+) Transcript_98220:326-943(+)